MPISALMMAAALAAHPADIVLVKDEATVAACERLGEVKASALWGGAMTGYARSKVLSSFKKNAVRMGATHVVLLDASTGFSGSFMLGTAYRCGGRPETREMGE